MSMDRERLASLWQSYVQGHLEGADLEWFLQVLNDPAKSEEIKKQIEEMLMHASDAQSVDADMEARIRQRLMSVVVAEQSMARRPFIGRTSLLAAASLLLVLTAGWYTWIFRKTPDDGVAMAGGAQAVRRVPLAVAADHVVLTLSNGARIPLDGMADGMVAREGGTSVVKRQDQLEYGAGVISPLTPLHHTIETPRGGRYQVNLSDGTRVWLNAASGLRFPVRFSADVREVELTGQAYFEVAHDAGRPFIVHIGAARVEVFGTQFDVMGYRDDPEIRTTLLQGSVGFRAGQSLTMLKPGQQSTAGWKSHAVNVRDDLEVREIIGWREGRLHFEGEDIGQVCRALSRAFDVQLEYDERIRESFYASFPEGGRLEIVLKALEMTGKVKFEKRGEAWRAVPYL